MASIGGWILVILIGVVGMIIQWKLKSVFAKYSKVLSPGGLTGAQIAQKMLNDNGIYDVQVTSVNGTLTDHYDPTKKTVNLSQDVFRTNSVSAAAVAAHECGHAVQHAVGYAPLGLRSALVPIVNFTGRWVSWVILAGLLLIKVFPSLLLIGILLFAMSTLFSLVTLPVEINASARALQWIRQHDITTADTHQYAESALRSAAYTYVMAAITSLATLAYYIMIYLDRK